MCMCVCVNVHVCVCKCACACVPVCTWFLEIPCVWKLICAFVCSTVFQFFIASTLVNIIGGRGLSNEARCEFLAKKRY